MQVYRGMDIGTAKATPEEQCLVRHHLVDVLEIGEPYNVNRFMEMCRPVLDDLTRRGKSCILAGGSGLYARSLLYGHQLLPSDKAVYSDVWRQVLEGRLDALAAELAAISPDCAANVRRNPRHLARAVEILRLTGMAPDHPALQPVPVPETPENRWTEIVIMPPWPEHRECIARRTRQMLDGGWIEETQRLLEAGLEQAPTARQALGYPEVAAHLRGEIKTADELGARIAAKTIQLARRQRTWFRHQHPRAVQLPLFMLDPVAGAEACLEILRNPSAASRKISGET